MDFINRLRLFIPAIRLAHNTCNSSHISKFHHKATLVPSSMKRLPRTKCRTNVLLGFSLLNFFGINEDEDSEDKMIDTIKRGLLFLQVIITEVFYEVLSFVVNLYSINNLIRLQ